MKTRVSWGWTMGILVCATLLAVPARAATDAEIQASIQARLAQANLDASTHIQVTVDHGVARLRGTAPSLVDSRTAERLARKETKEVVNQVLVQPEPRSDKEILKDAEGAVLSYPYYGVFDAVSVDVDKGEVTLRGWVLQPWYSRGIESDVARVAGIRALNNQIEVESNTPLDWSLRRQLYRRIYHSLTFEQWAPLWDKPVRIVVNDGRVILAGRVLSNVERQVAGNIALGTLAFSVDNQVQVEGPRPKPSSAKPSPQPQPSSPTSGAVVS
jgi:osmotically-inducible protein OsmY